MKTLGSHEIDPESAGRFVHRGGEGVEIDPEFAGRFVQAAPWMATGSIQNSRDVSCKQICSGEEPVAKFRELSEKFCALLATQGSCSLQ